ncbi:carbamoyltransferase HypF [Stieleria sp. ICT_E10.1]|uniref:carbamoyltransferase HypF n=1 Tax=Stieleria sedimenti TaxID=2976331 RepID=UPI00217FBC6C|nr:carbamoyltransferase HypF [Stieleria sedimenti]MCS7465713.1 carbamoyltransferase HypF [Stieleria sedimenti]
MNEHLKRIRIRLTGRIQGVGFRPFVWTRASDAGLTGWVQNDSQGVTIEAQGERHNLATFLRGFEQGLPPLATIDSLETADLPTIEESRFTIRDSATSPHASTAVMADISVCLDCLGEMQDAHNRRHRYPFINCTNCGPRFTIVEDIPYDRAQTTMKSFEMCDRCREEYNDPSDRRFHAQPNACPECGPQIWFVASDELTPEASIRASKHDESSRVIESFAACVLGGGIVAVKGIGGFHLACDATNVDAIRKLRQRKGRIDKPFAIMVADSERAELFAEISRDERRLLESKERPIVLLQKRKPDVDAAGYSDMLAAVAPGNHCLGVMLPYSPLHHLLIEAVCPLLMTSGNLSDEPIARTNDEAVRRLGPLVDGFLFHDRDIHVVCDDSVTRRLGASVLPIRRSRGFAPMPIKLSQNGPSVVAVGGEMKATFCITQGQNAYISQHIGDVGNLETLGALQRNVDHYLQLFRIDADAVAADLHPSSLSGQFAEDLAKTLRVPLIRVQHHVAHAVSLIAEHQLDADQPILACCLDGTGYGTDGAIWGGEFLTVNCKGFERFAHLKYFPLPGGDASIRRPYRAALALLNAHGLPWDERLPCVSFCPTGVRRLLRQQLESNLHCFPTSSAGRLFDAVASLIGIRHEVSFEAQAAIELEALAAEVIGQVDSNAYRFQIAEASDHTSMQIRSHDLIGSICRDVIAGVDRRQIAAQFHHAVAGMISDVCRLGREQTGIDVVGLTGGVFQNALLTTSLTKLLEASGFNVLVHQQVPPNDGGLSLGQAVVARQRLDG